MDFECRASMNPKANSDSDPTNGMPNRAALAREVSTVIRYEESEGWLVYRGAS